MSNGNDNDDNDNNDNTNDDYRQVSNIRRTLVGN